MSRQADQITVADYVVSAVMPALLIVMILSLIYFLVEVAYAGHYPDQLRFVLFWFVLSTVLICRISMTISPGRALVYSLALTLAMVVVLPTFVKVPLDNPLGRLGQFVPLFLIGVMWFAAHFLTRDCTHTGDTEEETGMGLLQSVGLASTHAKPESAHDRTVKHPDEYLQRYQKEREQERRRFAPGTMIIYFSLGALPLFGLGQLLIPESNEGSRRWAFWLLTLYVASGLGLLMTTSFLGLRRYLRSRRLKMPSRMTSAWLLAGSALIVVLLFLGAFLPRPNAEYGSGRWLARAVSDVLQASKHALFGASGAEGESDADAPGSSKDPQGKEGREGEKGKQGEGQKPGGKEAGGRGGRGEGQGRGQEGKPGSKFAQSKERQPGRNTTPPPPPAGPWDRLGWALMAIVLLAALVLAYIYRDWLRLGLDALWSWWLQLFERKDKTQGQAKATEPPVTPPKPFATFRNPFDDPGRFGTPEEMVLYSFDALQSWAYEQEEGRNKEETPLEFALRLGGRHPPLGQNVRGVAEAYSRITYARGTASEQALNLLRTFWAELPPPVKPKPKKVVESDN